MSAVSTESVRTIAPFKGDHVGSLLRPERLKIARKQYAEGALSKEELRTIENEEILRIVAKQKEIGLKAITDGEFRRSWWHLDFLEHLNGIEGYVPEKGYLFEGIETRAYAVRTNGKISFNENHPFLEHFTFLKEAVGDDAVAKFTIPSPNQLLRPSIRKEADYADLDSYCKDIQQAYREAVQAFYDAGCRYLQLDDTQWGFLCDENFQKVYGAEELAAIKRYATENIQAILADLPEDLVVTTHVCRGNYQSRYAMQGAYEPVAKELFGQISYDGYFLEYDSERAGGFEPLRYFNGEGQVVLGLITSKTPQLEDKEEIKKRIQEAAEFVPLDQLAISPQCGFASTEEGNNLTEDEQWAKLKLVLQLAEEVWGN